MAIHFYEEDDVKSRLKDKRRLKDFIKTLVQAHLDIKKIDLSFIFCSDEGLLEKNITFLNHDTFTDIITFDLSEKTSELISEIYISVDRVAENAEKFGVKYNTELHRVIFHGVLHLCGFKDKKKAEQEQMRTKEDECLRNYFKAAK